MGKLLIIKVFFISFSYITLIENMCSGLKMHWHLSAKKENLYIAGFICHDKQFTVKSHVNKLVIILIIYSHIKHSIVQCQIANKCKGLAMHTAARKVFRPHYAILSCDFSFHLLSQLDADKFGII